MSSFSAISVESLLIGIGIGLLAGLAAAVWLAYALRGRAWDERRESARLREVLQSEHSQEVDRLQLEKEQLGQEAQRLHDRVEGLTHRIGSLEGQQDEWERTSKALESQRDELTRMTRELERAQTELRQQNSRYRERESEYQELQSKFQTEFENLANKIFENRSKQFREKNRTELDDVLNPLKERLSHFETSIRDSQQLSIKERTALKEQIRNLTDLNNQMLEDARSLTQALKGDSKVQGDWGEMVLESVLEKSGLVRGEQYDVQQSITGPDGRRQRPDVVIRLPEEKRIVVDSKVSLTAWKRFLEAETEPDRKVQAKSHCDSVRTHIKQLAARNYPELYGINSPDFVLLFIPIEPAFSLALREDQNLYLDAFERNIVLVTPSTLLATLSTIASLWKQEKQNQNVLRIAEEAGKLHDKFYGLYNDLIKVGNQINKTQQVYDSALNKVKTGKGNLISRVEKLRKLGARTQKKLESEWLEQAYEDGELPFGEGPDQS